jgi:Zn-dependent protease with chaperone function
MGDGDLAVLTPRRYPGISPKAFQHPADRAATAALASIPLVGTVLKKISELRLEKSLQQLLLADAIRIDERQLPNLWARHVEISQILDMERQPELYIVGAAEYNAAAIGTNRPMIILQSGLVSGLSPEELAVIVAHEQSHLLSEHTYYLTLMIILQRLLRVGLSPFGTLPIRALLLVLLEWHRCAELSSDRGAAVVTGDPLLVCRGLMRAIGGGVKDLNLDAFIQQSNDYVEHDDLLARPGRFLNEIGRTHPFAVKRVHELTRWVASGEYDRITSGSYVRRGEEPATTDEMRAATEHYRRRFLDVVDRAAGGAARVADQVGGWFRRDRDNGDGDEDVEV